MRERILNSIKDLRQQKDITQQCLAEAVGVSRQSIISIERGQYVPSLSLAIRIARFFGLPVETIFKLEE